MNESGGQIDTGWFFHWAGCSGPPKKGLKDYWYPPSGCASWRCDIQRRRYHQVERWHRARSFQSRVGKYLFLKSLLSFFAMHCSLFNFGRDPQERFLHENGRISSASNFHKTVLISGYFQVGKTLQPFVILFGRQSVLAKALQCKGPL